jgi:two-component system nitrate/nitrite response regulator NarL
MADVRLLIAAADPLVRTGLATLLSDSPGYEVVGQVSGDENLADEIDIYRPDVIIWDLGWEADEAVANMAELAGDLDQGEPAIVALLPHQDLAGLAWSAGARSLLFREVTRERLTAAVTAAAAGLTSLESELAEEVLPARTVEDTRPVEALTPRELEVLQLLAEGLANKGIAQRLDISDHTVKFHVNAIMGKLGAQSRTEAVVRATRQGLILL